ncbi:MULTISPECIES: glycosyltransferase family 2 protein [Aphanothece]|uniref:glycosyltransferase family 2 protein n=1 Tax=Aphanothece TaxID=1121 RepID=UPI00398569E7
MVSVIIPVFNRAGLLDQAVLSVLRQFYRPIEIIIVDDGSTDGTAAFVASLVKSHPSEIRALRISNSGPGFAREAGRRLAIGEFIQYLDSDDLLLPDKFAVQVAALRANPECGIAYGITRLVDEFGAVLREPYKWTAQQHERLFPALLVDRWWNTHTPLFRREVCDAVGPWSDMRMCEDWEYEARVAALGVRLVRCPQTLSEHRQHSQARLTGGGDPLEHCRDVARLISSLYASAKQAGVPTECAEMKHFSRWAFLEARRAGAAGLPDESRQCLNVARRAAGARSALQMQIYQLAAGLLGWKRAGLLAMHAESLRRSAPSGKGLPLAWLDVP